MVALLFSLYWIAAGAARAAGLPAGIADAGFAAAYGCVSVAVATAVIRPWRARRRRTAPINALAALLLGVNLYPMVTTAASGNTERWRAPADTLIASATARQSASGRPERDIYYVVLDGLGRPDVLRHHYDLDLERLVTFLETKGFYVPERAHSNYAQTYLSLAATLNLSYLDDVAAAMDSGSRDRRPLDYLIQHNTLMKLAKAAGYEVIGIGSDYAATERLDAADVCLCEQRGLHEIEQAAIGLTPFAALPLSPWTYDAHRQKTLDSFAALERSTARPARKLVFAHVLAPHPPFVFGPDGSPRQGSRPLSLRDGDHFDGDRLEYVNGYRDQAQFVANRIARLIEHLLAMPGAAPAIVLQGDHGPGSMLHWNDATATNMDERMGIFSAYFLPGEPEPALTPTISPVNGARAVARRYLGADLSPLAERSYFSTWDRPYDFLAVDP
jgi:hypothetical protein